MTILTCIYVQGQGRYTYARTIAYQLHLMPYTREAGAQALRHIKYQLHQLYQMP